MVTMANTKRRQSYDHILSMRGDVRSEYSDVTRRSNARANNQLQSETQSIDRAQRVIASSIEKEQRQLAASMCQHQTTKPRSRSAPRAPPPPAAARGGVQTQHTGEQRGRPVKQLNKGGATASKTHKKVSTDTN